MENNKFKKKARIREYPGEKLIDPNAVAAIYSSEFAPKKFGEAIIPNIGLLAGIPSVVRGFFALTVPAMPSSDNDAAKPVHGGTEIFILVLTILLNSVAILISSGIGRGV